MNTHERLGSVAVGAAVVALLFAACAENDPNLTEPSNPTELYAFSHVSAQYAQVLSRLPSKEAALQMLSQGNVSRLPDGRALMMLLYPEEATEALMNSEVARVKGRRGEVIHRFKLFPALAVAVPAAAAEPLIMAAEVAAVSPSRTYTTDGDYRNYSFWGVTSAGHGFQFVTGYRGNGLKLALIDTGVECGHPDLPCPLGYSFVPDRGPHTEDDCNHGTGVYSVVMAKRDGNDDYPYGYAPSAQTFMYRTDISGPDAFGRCGHSSTLMAAAVDMAASPSSPVHVLSISTSGTLDDPAFELSLIEAYARGVLIVASAGNTGLNQVRYPAGYGSVMAIGGLRCHVGLLIFGGSSLCNSFLEPDPESTYSTSFPQYVELAAVYRDVKVDRAGGGTAFYNGNSYSTPTVAAAALLVMQLWSESRYHPNELRTHLKTWAYKDTPAYDWVRMGAGVLDVSAAMAHDPCATECGDLIEE